ncbi:uncharacterized protein C11orf86 homolog isoform X1 [Mustela erminea]|uniref:uncharacterized protein C11orf86 homolog isoform X1 n=1 Tax=Mustela erminea TaxID=36723 RepID=UPI0013866D4C|nr:uncharacterized protein C11orf86 homolog isoform X1 [Mustela erminea]
MGSGPRSQSLRGPRPTYGKLQEPWGKPRESRLRRALSLTQGHEKSRPSIEGSERLEMPGQEWLPGGPEDTERLIQAQQGKRQQWRKQYQQQVRRRWKSFVSSFPGVTLSRQASPQPPQGTTS